MNHQSLQKDIAQVTFLHYQQVGVNRNQKYSENGNPTTVKTGTIIQ